MVKAAVKARELRQLSDQELRGKLEELKAEQFNLRFQRAVGQLANPMRMRQVRKDIARILTILRERELGIESRREQARAARQKGAAQSA